MMAGAVKYTQFIDPRGRVVNELPTWAQSREACVRLYRLMVLTREFDAKAVALQRTGRLGTYASSLGQEAVGVGVGEAMYTDDILLPSFREHGALLSRGVSLRELFLYWGGDERGSDFAGPREDFPVSITIGGHAPHAAGVALAFKLRGGGRASVCVFGDGATSKGDVYEAMNLAGVWQLPVVFVANNNQWAISTPRIRQTAAKTLAQKAVAAGFEGEQVDGNDVVAVREVTRQAIDAARVSNRPHLIECLTYRLADHTTADDAGRYRENAVVGENRPNDPIARLRSYLNKAFEWSDAEEYALLGECRAVVETAANEYLQTAAQPPESIIDYMYAQLPADLKEQRARLQCTTGNRNENG